MKRGLITTVTDDSVAYLGLFLLLLLASLSDAADTGFAPGVRGFLARRAIDGIAAVGRVVDLMAGVSDSRLAGRAGYNAPFTLTR